MPTQSDKLTTLREQAAPGEIPYISKSRLLKFKKCPEQFRWSYIQGLREPETTAMARGTAIHETFEDFYHNVTEHVNEVGTFPEDLVAFLPDSTRWADYTEPYISNFINFERRRWKAVNEYGAPSVEDLLYLWLPAAIEAEAWVDEPWEDYDGPPWMGYADAIYWAPSVPGAEGGYDDVVIIDHKTGKTPIEKYRDEGIYLQGTYYRLLFEQDGYSVSGVGGYYPKKDDLILSPLSEERVALVYELVAELLRLSRTDQSPWELNEQPLCKWGAGDDEQCSFYDICGSRWGEPLKHDDRLRDLVQQGMSSYQIAQELDCETHHVNYAKKKLNLS